MTTISIGYGNLYGGHSAHDPNRIVNGLDWGARMPGIANLASSLGVGLFLAVELHEEENQHEALLGYFPAGWALFEGIGGNHLFYRTDTYGTVSKRNDLLSGNRWFTRWQLQHLASGDTFWVGGAHFIANGNNGRNENANRRLQAAEVVDLMRGLSPAVVAGDFNSATDAPNYPRAIMKAAGWLGLRDRGPAAGSQHNSFDGKMNGRWIEDILTTSTAAVSGAALVWNQGLGDHYGFLKASVELSPAPPVVTIPEPVIEPEVVPTLASLREPPSGHVPITIEVWDAAYNRKGVVGAPSSVTGSIQWNGPGSFEFTVDADHPRVADLTDEGARVVIRYRYAPWTAPMTLISGTVAELTGAGSFRDATRTFTVRDDWAVLNEIVGFPNPTGTLDQQGDDSAYFTRSGAAETVLKQIVEPNAARQGVALVVPSTLGRGSSCEVSVRMHPLSDRLFPTVDQAGIGVRIVQDGPTRYLIVRTPRTIDRVLTEESGAVLAGDFSISQPTVTRIVVASGGEGTGRFFREYVDDELEASYGLSRASFVDASDASSDWEAAKADVPEKLKARDEADVEKQKAAKRVADMDAAYDTADNAVDKAQDDVDDHPGVSKYVTRLNAAKAARTKAQGRLDDAEADLAKATTAYNTAAAAYTAAEALVPVKFDEMGVALQARADEALAEGAPKVSLKVTLAETKTFRFGRTFSLGDRVSVQLAGSPVLSDLVREVGFSYTAEDGLVVTPTVGDWSEKTTDVLFRAVSVLARAVRDSVRR